MIKHNAFKNDNYLKTTMDNNLDFVVTNNIKNFQFLFKGKSVNRVSCPQN